ncbi:MAG: hypothetical protein ACI88A_001860 [Paraglaciecola sp.]|jgi:hypothetical protein
MCLPAPDISFVYDELVSIQTEVSEVVCFLGKLKWVPMQTTLLRSKRRGGY